MYILCTGAAALMLYLLFYHGVQQQLLFQKSKPVKQSNGAQSDLSKQMVRLMEEEALFKESDLTTAKMAGLLQVKPYLVSAALNNSLQQSFPEFVNRYRIKEAERMLATPAFDHYSIEAIAFESGFNTPSAFYTSFKKATGCTPAEYRGKAQGASKKTNSSKELFGAYQVTAYVLSATLCPRLKQVPTYCST